MVLQDGTEKSRKVFVTVPTEVGQTEAEEIGRCCGDVYQHIGQYHMTCMTKEQMRLYFIQASPLTDRLSRGFTYPAISPLHCWFYLNVVSYTMQVWSICLEM